MLELFLDAETRSPVNLITAGTAKYATQSEVIIVTWALGDGPVHVWDVLNTTPTSQGLAPLIKALQQADVIVAHNSYFDRTNLNRMPWWPKELAPLSKWRCSMAVALAHGLPGSLKHLCTVFKIAAEDAKTDGKEFINLFCKPRLDGSWATKQTHPEEWRGFLNYAKQDIPSMRAVWRKCPKWNWTEKEIALWHLDQTINDRGFAIDVELAEAAVRATTAEKKRLADRTGEITDGIVDSTTRRNLLLAYLLAEFGVDLPDLRADTLERRLEDPELPEYVKELLRIRLQASKSSSTKYKRLLQMEVGGRLYGTLQYCAANRTRRWGGRGFQPQNLPRPSLRPKEIEVAIAAMKGGFEDLVLPNVMEAASSAIRGVIVAPKGKRLPVSDLSNIEGRKLAWLAGEEWKLDAFRAYDAGTGSDLYKVAYGRSFGVDPESVEDDSDSRQVGKVMELSLGYQGGVNAFVTMASTYNLDLELLAEKAWPTIPAVTLRDAQSIYAWAKSHRRTLGLSERVYIVCEALKTLWRDAHPEVVLLWSMMETAAVNATLNPGKLFRVNDKLQFDRIGAWLRLRLPSGGYLCYPYPRVEGNKLSYGGMNVYSKSWARIGTYGGKLVENATQASSRDVIADAMPRAEAEGYRVVLTVHDELVTETPDSDEFTAEGLSAIMAANADWNQGLPLAAKGKVLYRYGKG